MTQGSSENKNETLLSIKCFSSLLYKDNIYISQQAYSKFLGRIPFIIPSSLTIQNSTRESSYLELEEYHHHPSHVIHPLHSFEIITLYCLRTLDYQFANFYVTLTLHQFVNIVHDQNVQQYREITCFNVCPKRFKLIYNTT